MKTMGRTKANYKCVIGLESLSTCLVAEGCQASKVFLMQKEPLSMMLELSKSIRWLNDHACFSMFDSLAQVLTFLMCSFLRVSAKKLILLFFKKKLASECFYLLNMSHPGYSSIFNEKLCCYMYFSSALSS